MLKKPPTRLTSKESAPTKSAEDERKISWADLTDDEAKQNTSALRLTYSKWKRKFKGSNEKAPSPPPPSAPEVTPDAGNEIDVTTLVRRKKNLGKENEKVTQHPATTRWVIENADPSLSAPPRPIATDAAAAAECVDELAPEDLNLLVTTLTALSKSLGGFHTDETAHDTSKDDSGGAATPAETQAHHLHHPEAAAPPPPPPLFGVPSERWSGGAPSKATWDTTYFDSTTAAPPTHAAPYQQPWQMWQPNWLTQPTIEDVTVVGGLSLRTWRSHLIALAYADPQTLASRLQTGLARDLLQGLDTSLPRSRSLSTPVACPLPPPPPHAAQPLYQVQSAKPGGASSKQQRRPQQPPERPPPSEGRFKQIARCKSTPEYLLYVEHVPREQRRPEDPATPRVAGSSWREFSSEVRQWKIQLHRKAEALQAAIADSSGGLPPAAPPLLPPRDSS